MGGWWKETGYGEEEEEEEEMNGERNRGREEEIAHCNK